MHGKKLRGLFLTYRRELQAYLTSKLRDPDLAADLTQETFLRLAEQTSGRTAQIEHYRPYLYKTAHNLAVDHMRRRKRESISPLSEEQFSSLPDERPSPERAVGNRTELRQIQRVLLELPPRTQEVFRAIRIEGMTYREAAEHLRISESSVQKHLASAIKHVMQNLRPKEGG